MQLKKGYKKTEVGVIPEDWEVKKLNFIAPLQRGFDLPSTQLINGTFPVVYSNGIENYHSEYKVKAPGVVTGRSGTIGKVTFINENYWPHNTSLWVTSFYENEPLFIYYLYIYLKLERFGTGSGVPTLNRNDVHDFKVAIPTKAEQTAIADALSDADALISGMEKLITKKRNIKQGTMQVLLTGKKRLPGFSGKWEVKKLGEVCELKNGYAFKSKTYDDSGEYKVITIANVQDGYMDSTETNRITNLPSDIQPHQKLSIGDVLISMTGNVGRVCMVNSSNSLLNQRVGKLIPIIDKISLLSKINIEK